ncbi:hypothetical protein ACH5RR_007093 [Cinchona calisaya]|uniref:CCHC-type domain-containing protein n=1 Tax=Cinchona calisaya TaxID=153742 RepID=A0ABD3AQS8_9GENT
MVNLVAAYFNTPAVKRRNRNNNVGSNTPISTKSLNLFLRFPGRRKESVKRQMLECLARITHFDLSNLSIASDCKVFSKERGLSYKVKHGERIQNSSICKVLRWTRSKITPSPNSTHITFLWIGDKFQPVEYEGLHLICFGCGEYGHRQEDCRLKPTIGVEQAENTDATMDGLFLDKESLPTAKNPNVLNLEQLEKAPFGPWMMASSFAKRNMQRARNGMDNQSSIIINQNGSDPKNSTRLAEGKGKNISKNISNLDINKATTSLTKEKRNDSGTSVGVFGLKSAGDQVSGSRFTVLSEDCETNLGGNLGTSEADFEKPRQKIQAIPAPSMGTKFMAPRVQPQQKKAYQGKNTTWAKRNKENSDGITSKIMQGPQSFIEKTQTDPIKDTMELGLAKQDIPSEVPLTVIWNGRGVNKPRFKKTINDICELHNPHILVLIETKTKGYMAKKLSDTLGFSHVHIIDTIGFAGGIWMFWKTDVQVEVIDSNFQSITSIVKSPSGISWLFTTLYVSPIFAAREQLWNYLKKVKDIANVPWLIYGDFNEVLKPSEKRGGSKLQQNRVDKLFDCIDYCNLFDLNCKGPTFTWTNKRFGKASIRERLDRTYCNSLWRHLFEEAYVRVLPRTHSDHHPLLINLLGVPQPLINLRPFRMEAAWLTHPDFEEFVASNWLKSPNIAETIDLFTSACKTWNKQVFGNIFMRKRKVLARIEGLQKALSSNHST